MEPNTSGGYDYIYQYKDHLGNVRLSYTDNNGTTEIVEENNYYPFGLEHKGYNSNINGVENNYMTYNGKELDESLGLNWLDFSARNYDPAIGRWMNLDPLAEGMRRHSPYNFAFNNPIYFIDPDGMMPFGVNSGTEENEDKPSMRDDEFSRRMNAKGQEQYGNGYMPNYIAGQAGNDSNSSSSNGGDNDCCGVKSTDNGDGTTTLSSNGINYTANTVSVGKSTRTFISTTARGFSLGGIALGFRAKSLAKMGEITTSVGRWTVYSKDVLKITGKLSQYGKLMGRQAGGISIGFGYLDYQNDRISGYDFGFNSSVTSTGMFGDPFGFGLSATIYLWEITGGKQMAVDRAKALQRDVRNGMGPEEAKRKYSCFVKGTKVLMSDFSEKNIEEIELGDLIMSVNMETLKLEKDIVIEIPNVNQKYRIIQATFSNGTMNEFSPAHPYWVEGKGWAVFDIEEAKRELKFGVNQLENGDIVFYYDEGVLKKTEVLSLIDTKKYVEMYNVEFVKKNNTFFANKILVHNKRIN